MPVLLSNGSFGERPFTAHGSVREKEKLEFRDEDPRCIDIGLINNMPDAALGATERQTLNLLDAAGGEFVVRLRLYALPDVARSDLGQRHLKRLHYHDLGDLWNGHLDGLVVTGAEPRAPDLTDEPYWGTLTKVFDWAEHNTLSTITSCLAVHAAVLHIDGIGRYPLDQKRFGVFQFENVSNHAMMNGVPSHVRVPHSRWNEVREGDVLSCGYNILTRSEFAGVDMFVKQRKSLFVFLQGHPEYEAWTLLNEYRRDIERFLRHEIKAYPAMPQHYFDAEAADEFGRLQERLLADRSQDGLAEFPVAPIAKRLIDPWRATGTSIYRNWLGYLSARKALRSAPLRTVRL